MTTRSQIDLSASKSGASRSKGVLLSSFSSMIVALLLVATATLFAGSAQAATGQETDARNGALAPAPIDMVAADANDAKSEPEGAVAVYANFPSDTVASEDLTSLFYYSDSLFANPASSYNDVLAYASANLAASSFNSNTSGTDYTQKAKNVDRLLKDIGCSDIAVNDGFKYKPCEISGFSDKDSISEWAGDGVEYCVAWGIISGYADGSNRFGPWDIATRCQLGKMIAAADYMLYTI